jgi:Right handed beta helix region
MQVRLHFLLICTVLFSASSAANAAVSSQTLVVGNNPATCPTAKFTTIQSAVNAASPGATIHICAGTYVEQVSISKPLNIEADSGTILMPSAMQANAASLVDSTPLATAILVNGASDVTIEGLIVDGTNSGISECSPILFGVIFQNASGTVDRLTVRNFKLAASLNGCQSGSGIFVQSGSGQSSTVLIEKSTVHDFQKNGITANEVGTSATILYNVVTGVGPTPGAAQNGIQIGFGATGSITNNVVTNNVWSTCTAVTSCTAVATNILVTQSDGISVTGNTAGINNVGIFVDGNQPDVANNYTFASSVFDGIRLEGNGGTIKNNHAFNGAESGIYIDGNNNVVELNIITEAAVGILVASGSSGNMILTNNRVFGAPVTIQDPTVVELAKRISPLR